VTRDKSCGLEDRQWAGSYSKAKERN